MENQISDQSDKDDIALIQAGDLNSDPSPVPPNFQRSRAKRDPQKLRNAIYEARFAQRRNRFEKLKRKAAKWTVRELAHFSKRQLGIVTDFFKKVPRGCTIEGHERQRILNMLWEAKELHLKPIKSDPSERYTRTRNGRDNVEEFTGEPLPSQFSGLPCMTGKNLSWFRYSAKFGRPIPRGEDGAAEELPKLKQQFRLLDKSYRKYLASKGCTIQKPPNPEPGLPSQFVGLVNYNGKDLSWARYKKKLGPNFPKGPDGAQEGRELKAAFWDLQNSYADYLISIGKEPAAKKFKLLNGASFGESSVSTVRNVWNDHDAKEDVQLNGGDQNSDSNPQQSVRFIDLVKYYQPQSGSGECLQFGQPQMDMKDYQD